MKFRLISNRFAPLQDNDCVFLVADAWDDWFKYTTMYHVIYRDTDGVSHKIGDVKIGEFEMATGQRTASIPEEFIRLQENFFSIGQDDSYYENLNVLGDNFRDEFLLAMRDMAKDVDLFERARDEDVTGISLLRFISDKAVTGQFRRMALGGARLTEFSFTYAPPSQSKRSEPPVFEFKVVPEASPPTNLHVLIGRNGVGKTTMMNQLANALVRPSEGKHGEFIWASNDYLSETESFPNIISVTFSAFDPFEPLPSRENTLSSVRYQYIGLKHAGKDANGKPKAPKAPEDLAADFGKSVQVIVTQAAKRERWRQALALLASDTLFKRAEVWDLIDAHSSLLREYKQYDAFKPRRSP